jgi:aryl-alcohol dehydrogenase-like predicted oxidoreductase
MDYVSVCGPNGDCKKFSRLVMGTDHLAQNAWTSATQTALSEDGIFNVFDEAAKLGINFYDSSPIYVGGIEYTLGKWVKSRGPMVVPDSFYCSSLLNPDRKLYSLSKGGFPTDLFYSKRLETGPHSPELLDQLKSQGILNPATPPAGDGSIALQNVPPGTYASRLYGDPSLIEKRVGEELGNSTSNLNNDITVYLMHRDDHDYLRFDAINRNQNSVQNILQALGSPGIRGKYWVHGWSNWTPERINESLAVAKANAALPKPGFTSPYFSLFEMSDRTIHAGGVQVTHEDMMNPGFLPGIKIMSYSPLGGFSILDQVEPRWENARKIALAKFNSGDAYWQNVYKAIFTDANAARWDRVVAFTKKFNLDHATQFTEDQVINAYALAHPRADFLIVGPVSVDELRRSVGSLDLSKMLTKSDLEYLHSGASP